jgi:hypothetical protein
MHNKFPTLVKVIQVFPQDYLEIINSNQGSTSSNTSTTITSAQLYKFNLPAMDNNRRVWISGSFLIHQVDEFLNNINIILQRSSMIWPSSPLIQVNKFSDEQWYLIMCYGLFLRFLFTSWLERKNSFGKESILFNFRYSSCEGFQF